MRSGLVLLFSSLLFAQDTSSPPAKGVLDGKVLNSATGEPVRKAHVSWFDLDGPHEARQKSSGGGSTLTDAEGRFTFPAMLPGTYALVASHDGFESPGARGAPKRERVTLARDEEKRGIVIRLTPLGVITGRISDEDGDPIRQAQVSAMVWQYTADGRTLSPRGSTPSNDLGEYRIYDLPPGRYFLKAGSSESMGGGSPESYGVLYYPGTADSAAAAAIEVGAGQQVQGIDLTLRLTHIARIRGRVLNPGHNLTVGMMKFAEGMSAISSMSVDDPEGKFELRASPGSYFLTAGSTIGGQHYSASVPIQVGAADMEGIELRLLAPMEIGGQLRIEGKTSGKLSRISVILESGGRTVQSMAGGGPNEDGSFVLQGLEPAVYQVSVHAPEDLYLKSVRWGDRDVMQSGLDLTQGAAESRLIVVLSANGGQVEGVVEDDQSPAAAMVALAPASAPISKALFKWADAGLTGHFRMRGIAPGSYKLFAWEDADPNQVLYDPDFLKPYDSKAQTVEISEGSRQSVRLKLIKQAGEQPPSQ